MARSHHGFTIVELLVVLSIIALLLSIVTPRYLDQIEVGKETVLRQNLATIRRILDQYHADKGSYPASLEALIDANYLRTIPQDPMVLKKTRPSQTAITTVGGTVTDNIDANWQIITKDENGQIGVYDVHSMSKGVGRDGIAYALW